MKVAVTRKKRVLIACERSGSMQRAVLALGHDCISCDLQAPEHKMPFYQCNALDLVHEGFDCLIAFPPCQFLSNVQAFKALESKERFALSELAAEFVSNLFYSPIPQVIIENPPGMLNQLFRAPDQYVQPWYFGDPYQKDIGLWLKNSPPIIATMYSTERRKIDNHCNGRMSPGEKSNMRSTWKYYPRMAAAIALQSLGSCLVNDS